VQSLFNSLTPPSVRTRLSSKTRRVQTSVLTYKTFQEFEPRPRVELTTTLIDFEWEVFDEGFSRDRQVQTGCKNRLPGSEDKLLSTER